MPHQPPFRTTPFWLQMASVAQCGGGGRAAAWAAIKIHLDCLKSTSPYWCCLVLLHINTIREFVVDHTAEGCCEEAPNSDTDILYVQAAQVVQNVVLLRVCCVDFGAGISWISHSVLVLEQENLISSSLSLCEYWSQMWFSIKVFRIYEIWVLQTFQQVDSLSATACCYSWNNILLCSFVLFFYSLYMLS